MSQVIDEEIAQSMVALVRAAVQLARLAGYANVDIDEVLHLAVSMTSFEVSDDAL
jgi:hypothetical protein